jgi:hypothetical protein
MSPRCLHHPPARRSLISDGRPACYYQDRTGIYPKHGEHAARHFRAFMTGFLYGAWDRSLGAVVFYDRPEV